MRALRLRRALRRGGSSLPLVVETDDGLYVAKLRGAAQGPAALVAEIVVAALAERLGLRVPQRVLLRLDPGFECLDRDAELADLLRASRGVNLGLRYLSGARELCAADATRLDGETATRILWLDRLVMNVDRTARNPNLLAWQGAVWLIDHGAALPFQHDWAAVSEATPRRPGPVGAAHLLHARAAGLALRDAGLARRLTRAVLQAAVDQVPEEFLLPLLPAGAADDALRRRRAAYVALLWKRLRAPRPFLAGPAAAQVAAAAASG
ncbi:MAG: HipA family kinase [Deltaproteobacteria bacterium]|nr:HipA family kinase [Deltaproteobacteria bacterium]